MMQDHLEDSLDKTFDDGLFASAQANPAAVFIFTDGLATSNNCCSSLKNDPAMGTVSPDALPDFGEYARLAAAPRPTATIISSSKNS